MLVRLTLTANSTTVLIELYAPLFDKHNAVVFRCWGLGIRWWFSLCWSLFAGLLYFYAFAILDTLYFSPKSFEGDWHFQVSRLLRKDRYLPYF